MKKLYFLLAVLPFFASAQVNSVDSMYYGGQWREYYYYVPAAYNPGTPLPLVLNLHGYGSNNWQQELYGDFRQIADTAHFIIVQPNGTFDLTGNRFWNAGFGAAVDDVGFLSALIDHLSAQYSINPQRVYSTGMSNGGFMSHTLACALGNRIAAIASVTGSITPLQYATCNPVRPIPVMQIHGTADPTVPYLGNANMLPIEDVVAYWVGQDQCPATPVITAVPNIAPLDGCTAEHYVYGPGANGMNVEFYKITGGGHTWPGAPINIGVTNQDFKASKEIWRFFSEYELPAQFLDVDGLSVENDLIAYPNPFSDYVDIDLKGNIVNGEFILYDAVGQVVFSTRLDNVSRVHVPTTPLAKGLYIATVLDATGSAKALKMVKY